MTFDTTKLLIVWECTLTTRSKRIKLFKKKIKKKSPDKHNGYVWIYLWVSIWHSWIKHHDGLLRHLIAGLGRKVSIETSTTAQIPSECCLQYLTKWLSREGTSGEGISNSAVIWKKYVPFSMYIYKCMLTIIVLILDLVFKFSNDSDNLNI